MKSLLPILYFSLYTLAFGQITNVNTTTNATRDTLPLAFSKLNTNDTWLAAVSATKTNPTFYGTFTLTSTTNHVIFAATNSPPASAAAPVKWISVQINGETNAYRIPLYE